MILNLDLSQVRFSTTAPLKSQLGTKLDFTRLLADSEVRVNLKMKFQLKCELNYVATF